jgi:hypothetical protein
MREAICLFDGAEIGELLARGISGQLNPDPVGHGVLRDLGKPA